MRRRLVASTAAISLATLLALGIPLGLVETARVRTDERARLEREADAVAAAVDDRIEAAQTLSTVALQRFVPSGHQVVVTTANGKQVTVGAPVAGRSVRVRSGEATLGSTVTAIAPAAEAAGRVQRAWLLIGLLGTGGVVAAIGLSLLQARSLVRPLERLARTSARLGHGDFSARAGHFGLPEIDEVADALDTSAERIARLVAREREFSANVSHQLRTPLTALRLQLEEIASEANVDAALAEADRIEATIAHLLAAAKDERTSGGEELGVVLLVRRHEESWRPRLKLAGRTLKVTRRGAAGSAVSAGAVGQALDVLLENAFHHGSGTVTIVVEDQGGGVLIAVEDEGKGIPHGAEAQIFERGQSLGDGTGIGLHLARALLAAEGGQLRLARSSPPRFEIRFPLRET